MKKWSLRILVGFAVLLILIAIVVQIVLWTNLPKNLVIAQIEQQMGLRISAQNLSTGWLGRTTLTDVSLGLPLSQKSFLDVKTLKVKHTTLFGLIFGKSVAIDSIEVDQPVVSVQQDSSGKWNLLEVAELLAKTGGEKPAADAQQQGIPKLPKVRLVDGTIKITDNQGHSGTAAPLNVNGEPDGTLVWNYDLKIAESVSLKGKVAPGGSWQHEITLSVRNLEPFLKHWGLPAYHADLDGAWYGSLKGSDVVGLLKLNHLTAQAVPKAGNVELTGAIDVTAGSAITINPRQIKLKTTGAVPDVQVAAGTITLENSVIQATALQVGAFGGLSVLDAKFDSRTMAGDVQARWNGLLLPNNISHSGSITASLRMPFAGHPAINVDLVSNGSTLSGKWNAKANLAGIGSSWQSIDWIFTVPNFAWNGSQPIQLTQLTGHISQRGPDIELTDLTLPDRPHLVSRAAYNGDTSNWYVWMNLNESISGASGLIPLGLSIDAWGNDRKYTLHEMNLQLADAFIWAGGNYDRDQPNPVNFDMYLSQMPRQASSPVQGHFVGSFHLAGLLFKGEDAKFHPEIGIAGELKSSDLVVQSRPVGEVDLKISGDVQDFEAKLHTEELLLFQGRWHLSALFPDSRRGLQLKLQVQDLPLEDLAKFAKVDGITGQVANADWTFDIPSTRLTDIQMESNYTLHDVSASGFSVDRVEFKSSLDHGVFKIAPLRASSGAGRVDGSVALDLANPSHLLTEFTIAKWPYGSSTGALTTLSAYTKLDIDLKRLGAAGELRSAIDVMFNNAQIMHGEAEANIGGRLITVKKIHGNILSGVLDGSAAVDLDRPLQATGRIQWQDVDASAFATAIPQLNGLGGIFSGTISLAPANEPRPIAPVRIDVNIAAKDGHFRSMKIGGSDLLAVRAVAYANTDRFVLDHSEIDVAGGQVRVWARLSSGLSSQAAIIDLDNLQLNQLAHIDVNRTSDMPGLVNGRFNAIGSASNLNQLTGNGHIALTQTDLASFGPIRALYNVMNAGGGSKPSGTGSFDIALEQNALTINNFRFFNRGINATGIFNVGPSLWKSPETPIGGQVVGTLGLLHGSRLTILSDFDKVFSQFQASLTAINVGGTIAKPTYSSAGVDAIGGSLREIIMGDARANGK